MCILVLVSGNGSNLQALIDAQKQGLLGGGVISVVVSDRAGAYALERARLEGIPALTEIPDPRLPPQDRRQELSKRILAIAIAYNARLIILAGFLSILAGTILSVYKNRIINLHPSLLPKYGGKGMYGDRVHRAVLAAMETESGCTVHIVDEGTDTGPVLLQRKVPVLGGDSPETLAKRIHAEEHIAIVEATVMMVRRITEEKI